MQNVKWKMQKRNAHKVRRNGAIVGQAVALY